ncbi:MAG: 4-alpha-glucanotransferase [Alphaproteobacteria bacterium]
MTDEAVRALARRAGIQPDWIDYLGVPRQVPPPILVRILAAMGLPAGTPDDIRASTDRLDRSQAGVAPGSLVTADAGAPIALPAALAGEPLEIELEDGRRIAAVPRAGADGGTMLPPVDVPGYHRVRSGGGEFGLAVAPPRAVTVEDVVPGGRPWGLVAPLYGIRRGGDGGIGDWGGAAALAAAAAAAGADALALSPCHALFAAAPERFSPYGPSSRILLNVLHGDPALALGTDRVAAATGRAGRRAARRALETMRLIDWPAAARAKLEWLRLLFDGLVADGPPDDFLAFRRAEGAALEEHARFEAIQAEQLRRGAGWSWRRWPAGLRDPRGAAVQAFAAAHPREVGFHAFLQWIVHRSRHLAQAHARKSGMRIGLIADLAVGMDGDGSEAWSRQGAVMAGLGIGAPPDHLNTAGQNWGLSTFSPRALVDDGFAPFIATLRAAMRDAGGLRVDHVMGLTRMWLAPEGAPPGEGAYVTFPADDLLRLLALESARHRAIVIGEDLGTVPPGFRPRLAARGIYGMRVLWFERDEGGGFAPPERWPADAVAMTSTHDLPTVAGWWRGADIALRSAIAGRVGPDPAEAAARAADRRRLWQALVSARAASGAPPRATGPVVDAAVRFTARTASRLLLLPIEDVLGSTDQPNLPGTTDEHPNWRRRLPAPADRLLERPRASARLDAVRRERATG